MMIVEFLKVCSQNEKISKNKENMNLISKIIVSFKNNEAFFLKGNYNAFFLVNNNKIHYFNKIEKIREPRRIPFINIYNLNAVIDILLSSWCPIWEYLESSSRSFQISQYNWALHSQQWEKIKNLFEILSHQPFKATVTKEILTLQDKQVQNPFFTS